MSLDVLLFVPDQAAPLREVARTLRGDGLFALTSWEQSGSRSSTRQASQQRCIAAEMELADEFGMAAAARYLAMARGAGALNP
jgi:hypothetical protein